MNIKESLSWLESYHADFTSRLQLIIDNTLSHNPQMLSYVEALIDTVANWKNRKSFSVPTLEGLLVNMYQGAVLGVTLPSCTNLFDINSFIPYILSRNENFYWIGEQVIINPEQPSGETELVCEELNMWIGNIDGDTIEASKIQSLEESIHSSSSSYVFNSIFNPESLAPVQGGDIATYLLKDREYWKLSILAPQLNVPQISQ